MDSEFSDEENYEKVYTCSCQNCDPKTGKCPINCEDEYEGPLMSKLEIEEYKKFIKKRNEKIRIRQEKLKEEKEKKERQIKYVERKKREKLDKENREKIIIKIQSLFRCYQKRNVLENKKRRKRNLLKNKERRKNRAKYKKKKR